jgi:diadenosine tetraphosphate (Ap4A) HIT family hydrolase
MSCFICDKHAGGTSNQPPGGYIYEDEHWMVCHFPAEQSALGQLVIESKRHFLDFSEMTDEEARSYGFLVKKLYLALKQITGAERVYSLVTIDGVPHFHAHFIPRMSHSITKGMKFITQERSCDEKEATEVARKLNAMFN